MVKSALRDKDKKVLNLVVESFVRLGRPVSSGAISETRRITASPATLRNIMAKLEFTSRVQIANWVRDRGY